MNELNWLVAAPEIFLLVAACFIALADLWVADERRRITFWMSQASVAVFTLLHAKLLNTGLVTGAAASVNALQGLMVSDPMGHLLAVAAGVAVMITLAYAQPYIGSRELSKGELYVLTLFALLGVSVMISANNFLVS